MDIKAPLINGNFVFGALSEIGIIKLTASKKEVRIYSARFICLWTSIRDNFLSTRLDVEAFGGIVYAPVSPLFQAVYPRAWGRYKVFFFYL
jgi:hypothetical protein